MPRTVENEPLTRHSALLYAGDFDKLGAYFPKIGATVALRKIVRSYLTQIDAQVPQAQIEMKEPIDV